MKRLAAAAAAAPAALATLGLLASLSAAPLSAEEAAPPAADATKLSASPWVVECGNDGKTLSCQTLIRVIENEKRQLVVLMAVRVAPETKKPAANLQLPLGILVAEPASIKVDDGASATLAVETCRPDGCVAGGPLTDAMVQAMRVGKQLSVSFKGANHQLVSITLPLSGFAIAYDKVK